MKAPTWDQYMAPALRFLSDGHVARTREVVAAAADLLELSDEHRAIVIPSGQLQWVNRGNWALSYLARAGAVHRPGRGRYEITDIGHKLLHEHPDGIREKDLRALSGDPNAPHTFKVFPPVSLNTESDPESGDEDSTLDPDEQIEAGVARINTDVASELLSRVLAQEPVFFEQAVLDCSSPWATAEPRDQLDARNSPATAASTESSPRMRSA